jgi:hypothetical protein
VFSQNLGGIASFIQQQQQCHNAYAIAIRSVMRDTPLISYFTSLFTKAEGKAVPSYHVFLPRHFCSFLLTKHHNFLTPCLTILLFEYQHWQINTKLTLL